MSVSAKVEQAWANPKAARSEIVSRLERARDRDRELKAFLRFYSFDEESEIEEHAALAGTIFAAKDCFQISGKPLTYGLEPPLLSRAPGEALILRDFKKKGAFLAGSTNLDEACLTSYGDNRHFGRTVNPLRLERSPLGSSCGSASAVAAGIVDFALGSDSGGSVRAPAAACGICGFKGSPAVLPADGMVVAFPEFDEPGLLTSCLEDLVYLLDVRTVLKTEQMSCGDYEILLPARSELELVSPWMLGAYEHAVAGISGKLRVRQLSEEIGFRRALDIRRVLAAGWFREFVDFWRLGSARLSDAGRALLELGRSLPSETVEEARFALEDLRGEIRSHFSRKEFLLTPSIPEDPPLWTELEEGGAEVDAPINFFLAIANVCALPALSFPAVCGASTQVQLSLQLIGAQGSDWHLLNVAQCLQNLNNTKISQ